MAWDQLEQGLAAQGSTEVVLVWVLGLAVLAAASVMVSEGVSEEASEGASEGALGELLGPHWVAAWAA